MSSTKPFETAAVLMRPFALAALDHALPCRMRRADRVTQPSGIDLDPDTRQVTPVGIPARLHRRWPVPESVCVVDTGMDQLIHLLVADLEIPTVQAPGQCRAPRAMTGVIVFVDPAGIVKHRKQVADNLIDVQPEAGIKVNGLPGHFHRLGQPEQASVRPNARPVPHTVVAPPVATVLIADGVQQLAGQNA